MASHATSIPAPTRHVHAEDLVTVVDGKVRFNLSALMRRAHQEGRFALQIARARSESVAERHRILSRFLKRIWAEAKFEASERRRRIKADADMNVYLAERAKEAVALATRYGNDRWRIEQAILSEHMRERLDTAKLDRLQAALSVVREG